MSVVDTMWLSAIRVGTARMGWLRRGSPSAFGGRRSRGVTLLELMIVVAIVGVLASIAFPSYQDSVRKARRADAFDALLHILNLQEKRRANNSTYGTLAQIGFSGTTSTEGWYTIAIANPAAVGYVATATAVAGSTQARDSACTVLTLTVSAATPRGNRTPAACW